MVATVAIETTALPQGINVFNSVARALTTPYTKSFRHSAAKGGQGWRGVKVVIDATAITSTPSVVFKIQGFDRLSGKYWDILTSAAVATVSTTVLTVYPGATAAANVTINDILPDEWRVIATHGNTNSITYSVAAHLLP